jgi:hypothetical protein
MSGNYLDLARTHAPLLLIAAPLIGAALVLVSGTARVGWILASVVGGVTAFMALDFASGVFSGAMTNFAVVAPTLLRRWRRGVCGGVDRADCGADCVCGGRIVEGCGR